MKPLPVKRRRYSEAELIEVLRLAMSRNTTRAVASTFGVSQAQLSKILNGSQPLTARTAERLGYRQIREYEAS